MRKANTSKLTIFLVAGSVLLAVVLLVWAVLQKYDNGNWLETAYERKIKKIELIDAMRTGLLISAEAEKSSVMADTDEESEKFAEQSTRASAAMEEKRLELKRLLDEEKGGREMELFRNFSGCWEKLQGVDREVLHLAVQNTNLKALKLSLGPAREDIDRLEAAMNQLMDSGASLPDALRITRLASRAILDATKIYMLEAPHIAETSDANMDKMESAMHQLDEQMDQTFDDLNGLTDEAGRSFLDAARASYEDFREVNSRILDLSRQNSNVRSLAMSLGQKRKVTAECLDSLAALDKAVNESVTFRATR